MQASAPFREHLDLFAATPSVGGLMALCEENYLALRRLAPRLPDLEGRLLSHRPGQADLLMEIVDQAPYTTLLRLTHLFPIVAPSGEPEPDALMRVYHDAAQVEILGLRQTVLPVLNHYDSPALAAKWRANLFLSKWLGYCVRQGHRFGGVATAGDPSHGRDRQLSSA